MIRSVSSALIHLALSCCVALGTLAAAEKSEESSKATRFELSSIRSGCGMQSGSADEFGYLVVTVGCEGRPALRVQGLGDLRDLVRVDDEAKALEFVRLFSTDQHWMLTGIAEWAEVLPGSESDLRSFIVNQRAFKNCCVPATVRSIGNPTDDMSFEIKRVLVDRSYRAYLVTEVVKADGAYQMTERKRLKADRAVSISVRQPSSAFSERTPRW